MAGPTTGSSRPAAASGFATCGLPATLRVRWQRWHTPDGLLPLRARDVDAAELQLQAEPFGYLNLRNRQVHFKPYRVIYRVVGQNIVVLVIADGRRNLKALLERRLLGAP